MSNMAIKRYGSRAQPLDTTPPIVKLLFWAYENPDEALEMGKIIIAVGGLMLFLGTIFKE